MWSNDKELFQLMRTKLFPAVVGDILDTMGFLHQFFAPSIKPLHEYGGCRQSDAGARSRCLRAQIQLWA